MNNLKVNQINLCEKHNLISTIKKYIEKYNIIIYISENIISNHNLWYNILSNNLCSNETEIYVFKKKGSNIMTNRNHNIILLYPNLITSTTKIKNNLQSKENKYQVFIIDDNYNSLLCHKKLSIYCKKLYLIQLKRSMQICDNSFPKIFDYNENLKNIYNVTMNIIKKYDETAKIAIYINLNERLLTQNSKSFKQLMIFGKFGEACTLKKNINESIVKLMKKMPLFIMTNNEKLFSKKIINQLIKDKTIKEHIIERGIVPDILIYINERADVLKKKLIHSGISQIHLLNVTNEL